MTGQKFRKGDKVRDCYRKVRVVLRADDSAVYFYDGGWVHPTKCFKVEG